MKNAIEKFNALIGISEKRKAVGVTFINTKENYDNINIEEATHQMFFCMMVKSATIGHSMKVKKEHMYCSAASEALGFTKPNDDFITGEIGFKRKMYESKEVAEKMVKKIPYIDHKIYGMIVQPLEKYKIEPDVVVIFGNPYMIMRIIQSYSYKYGPVKNIHFAGMSGVCTELVARAYKYNDLSVSMLCSGTRFAAEWKDDEMGIAFPYKMFSELLEAIEKTSNTFEPDNKKQEIRQRVKEKGIILSEKLIDGENYHGSSLGVARMGVKGYKVKGKNIK